MNNKILTINGQEHDFKTLTKLFSELSDKEKTELLDILGIGNVLDEDGNPIPVYSVDITSDKESTISKDYNRVLTGNLYNYYEIVNHKATSWQWTRDSGLPEEDKLWAIGKTGRVLELTQNDFTDNVSSQEIKFTLTVKVKDVTVTPDTISFSKLQFLSKVQIKTDNTVFIDLSPSKIEMEAEVDSSFEVESYRWYVNDTFKSASKNFTLYAETVTPGSSVNVKVEAIDRFGTIITDNMSIPRVKNGKDGEDGIGITGQSSFKSIVFKRSPDNTPLEAPPVGNESIENYWNPVPAGWSDGIPEGTGMVYQTTRIFTNDGQPPQQNFWTKPEIAVDTEFKDYAYSDSETMPDTPPPTGPNKDQDNDQDPVWHNNPTPASVWQAWRNVRNGVPESDWTIVRIKGEKGDPGQSVTTYTHIRYADTEYGANMDTDPFNDAGEARPYLGMVTTFNIVGPTDPAQYRWVKYIGSDGVAGDSGFIWIKYSQYYNGKDTDGTISMYDCPYIFKECGCPTNNCNSGDREDMVYIGITTGDKATESNNPEDYKWSKIKGEDGHTNYVLDMSNDNISIPTDSDGTAGSTAYDYAYSNLTLYYGNDIVPKTEYIIELTASAGVSYTASNSNHYIKVTNLVGNIGEIVVNVFTNNTEKRKIASGTFNISKVKGVSTYEIMPSTSSFVASNTYGEASVTPNFLEVKIIENTGNSIKNITDGKLTMKYVYKTTNTSTTQDGTLIEIGKAYPINVAGDPVSIELRYARPTSKGDTVVDIETLPFVRDGISGITTESRYRTTNSTGVIPYLSDTDKQNPTPPNWSTEVPTLTPGEALWVIQAKKRADTGALIGVWSNPILMTGTKGDTGGGGTGYSIISSNPLQSIAVGSDGIAGVGQSYNIDLNIFSNNDKLIAVSSEAAVDNNTKYYIRKPTVSKSGISSRIIDNDTIAIDVAVNTIFTKEEGSIVIPIEIVVGQAKVLMKSSFTLVPIFTAEDVMSLNLITTSAVVKYTGTDGLEGPNEIILQAVQQNYSDTITWEAYSGNINITSNLEPVPGNPLKRRINSNNLFRDSTVSTVKISTANGLWDQVTITKVRNGLDGNGIKGTTGSIPRLMEWVNGYTYENGGEYKDYVYFRSEDSTLEGWYTVNPNKDSSGNPIRTTLQFPAVPPSSATTSNTTPATIKKEPFTKSGMFGTIIAEQANIAGFIFRNQILNSQEIGYQSCATQNDKGPYPKLTIDGKKGIIKFLERMKLDENGITLKDDCNRDRMLFRWENGTPILKFLDEQGQPTWVAGKDGYKTEYIEVIPDKFIPFYGAKTDIPASYTDILSFNHQGSFYYAVNGVICMCPDDFGDPKQRTDIDRRSIFKIGYKFIRGTKSQAPENYNNKIVTINNEFTSSPIQDGWYVVTVDKAGGRVGVVRIIDGFIVDGVIEVPVDFTQYNYHDCGTNGFPPCGNFGNGNF